MRYSILIGAGILAAGGLLYYSNSRVNSRQIQGAIGQRDVYRDGLVNAADVKVTPGSAPVASKALLESKEFKALSKNQAFQSLLSNSSFALVAQNQALIALLSNPSFAALAKNDVFMHFLESGALEKLSADLQAGNSSALNEWLVANNAQSLMENAAFLQLTSSAGLIALLSNASNSQALVHMLTSESFAALEQNSQFLMLLSNPAFANALQSGTAANLASELAHY
jgi:hypothetical protein